MIQRGSTMTIKRLTVDIAFEIGYKVCLLSCSVDQTVVLYYQFMFALGSNLVGQSSLFSVFICGFLLTDSDIKKLVPTFLLVIKYQGKVIPDRLLVAFLLIQLTCYFLI
jgi:hypothetical protein